MDGAVAGKDADVTRELKLALIVGFSLVLVVAVLISDHFAALRADSARNLANAAGDAPGLTIVGDGIGSDPYGMNIKLPATEVKKPKAEPPEIFNGGRADRTKPGTNGPGTNGPGTSGPGNGVKSDPQAEKIVTTPDASYVAVEGDTFAAIARKFYSTPNLAQKLADYNKTDPRALKVAQKLLIPAREVLEGKAVSGKPAANPAPGGAPADNAPGSDPSLATTMNPVTDYTVAPGDTVSGIAKKKLGSFSRITDIYKLNSGLEGNEGSLKIGQVLKLPAR